jgi:hypothetical protein
MLSWFFVGARASVVSPARWWRRAIMWLRAGRDLVRTASPWGGAYAYSLIASEGASIGDARSDPPGLPFLMDVRGRNRRSGLHRGGAAALYVCNRGCVAWQCLVCTYS